MEKAVLMNYLTEQEETGILLQRIFSNRWHEVFLIDAIKNEKYSYGDFFSMILRCREKLDELGLEPNGTICTIMNNSIHKRILPIKKFHKINIINDKKGFVYKFRKMIKDNRKIFNNIS